ncbi:putative synaptogyrin-2 like protein, partial [Bombina bombina]|uniref:putative synaptogyrin-2 like protein n=1 Tax=Bombina bombina TaxID=8345 RepID=UPI00235A860C
IAYDLDEAMTCAAISDGNCTKPQGTAFEIENLLYFIAGLWSFLWFVGFCFLTNQWSITDPHSYLTGADNARAAIAFSFFSILTWIPLAFLAYKRYTAGVDDFSTDYVDPSQDTTTPYSSYPNTVSDSYQQPPFTQNSDTGEYQPPAY